MSRGLDRRQVLRLTVPPVVAVLSMLALAIYLQHTPSRLGDSEIIQRAFLQDRLTSHVELVLVSFGLAAVVALPLGVVLARAGRGWRIPVFAVANLGQAVPSIAILAIAFTLTGIGFRTAVWALVLYALLPILRNTLVGVQGVDPAVVEAARGMGMTYPQALRRVLLPLAAPVIFAGLRTSLVLVVGTATLGNFIGAHGLGDVISAGIDSGRARIVLTGAVMVAVLALLLDWLLALVERGLTPRTLVIQGVEP